MKSDMKSENLVLIESLLRLLPQALTAIDEFGHLIYLNSSALTEPGSNSGNTDELYSKRLGLGQLDKTILEWNEGSFQGATAGDTVSNPFSEDACAV